MKLHALLLLASILLTITPQLTADEVHVSLPAGFTSPAASLNPSPLRANPQETLSPPHPTAEPDTPSQSPGQDMTWVERSPDNAAAATAGPAHTPEAAVTLPYDQLMEGCCSPSLVSSLHSDFLATSGPEPRDTGARALLCIVLSALEACCLLVCMIGLIAAMCMLASP